ncbi:hypothetical protein [Desulfosarcina widdelii]|uniref:hypothetical protein n=1 Tax=Desulfosarcina widdelii TaxID=947919 RepID=UPI0012D308EA|nr:hypothetical protein [Desulfosarcina widdelii]
MGMSAPHPFFAKHPNRSYLKYQRDALFTSNSIAGLSDPWMAVAGVCPPAMKLRDRAFRFPFGKIYDI